MDLPEQPRVNLGQFLRRLAARRDRLDGGRVHPHAVGHLVHELRQPVDGEARPVLRLALLADGARPLVAREEFEVGEGVLAVLAIARPRGFEALLRSLTMSILGKGTSYARAARFGQLIVDWDTDLAYASAYARGGKHGNGTSCQVVQERP